MPASIVIPQKTNSDMTLNLVRQIHQYEPESEVIVIHDTQDDEMKELPDCRLIRNRGKGVTAAWNHGIEEAANSRVILLNNDVVCSGRFVDLLDPDRMYSVLAGAVWRYERMLGDHVGLIGGAGKQWLEGWCLSLYRDDWEGIGRFDESMVMYFSDLDFQWRVISRGVRGLAMVPALPLHHLGHQTTHNTPGVWSQWQKDRATFKRKLEAMSR